MSCDDPYRKQLSDLENEEVVLHRAGAPDLHGKVAEIQDDGCVIAIKGKDHERILNVFVAYRDLRGVSKEEWDMDVIAH